MDPTLNGLLGTTGGGLDANGLQTQMDQQYAEAFNTVLKSFTKEMVSEIMSAMQDAMFEGDQG